MLHKLFLSCAGLAVFLPLLSAQSFEWVATGGGARSDKTRGIQFDREGNVLMVGEMTGEGRLGPLTIPGVGGVDCFIAKVDPQGKALWATTFGGSLIDRGYAVAADAAGNVYVTGHYQSADIMVAGKALPLAGDYDIFLTKYDSEGKLLWTRTAGGPGYDYGHGLAIDAGGDVVISGAAGAGARFGEITLTGARAIFCAKYTGEGRLVWVRGSEGKASCSGHGVALDAGGNIYLGGLASGTGSMDGQAIEAPGRTDGLVIKMSPEGKVMWLRQTPGASSALFHDITADASGRVWAVGMFKGKLQSGGGSWTTTNEKDSDGFVVHYDTEGALRWTQVIQSPATDYMLGAAPDGKGGVFVTGEHGNGARLAGEVLAAKAATGIFLVAFDAKGRKQWLLQAGGEKASNAYTAAFDGKGGLVIAGACTGPAEFGEKAVGATGGADFHGARVQVP